MRHPRTSVLLPPPVRPRAGEHRGPRTRRLRRPGPVRHDDHHGRLTEAQNARLLQEKQTAESIASRRAERIGELRRRSPRRIARSASCSRIDSPTQNLGDIENRLGNVVSVLLDAQTDMAASLRRATRICSSTTLAAHGTRGERPDLQLRLRLRATVPRKPSPVGPHSVGSSASGT